MFTEDLGLFVSDFGEDVMVNAVAARAVFDAASELALGDVLMAAPTLLLPATVAAAEGQICVVRGVSYRVRQVLDEPPDGALRRLVLARA